MLHLQKLSDKLEFLWFKASMYSKKCLCASAVILARKWSYCEINVKLMCMRLLLKFSCLPRQSKIKSISFSVWEHHYSGFNYASIVKLQPQITRWSDGMFNVAAASVDSDVTSCQVFNTIETLHQSFLDNKVHGCFSTFFLILGKSSFSVLKTPSTAEWVSLDGECE